MRKGKVTNRFKLQAQGVVIPLVENTLISYLRKWFDDSFTGRNHIAGAEK